MKLSALNAVHFMCQASRIVWVWQCCASDLLLMFLWAVNSTDFCVYKHCIQVPITQKHTEQSSAKIKRKLHLWFVFPFFLHWTTQRKEEKQLFLCHLGQNSLSMLSKCFLYFMFRILYWAAPKQFGHNSILSERNRTCRSNNHFKFSIGLKCEKWGNFFVVYKHLKNKRCFLYTERHTQHEFRPSFVCFQLEMQRQTFLQFSHVQFFSIFIAHMNGIYNTNSIKCKETHSISHAMPCMPSQIHSNFEML